MSTAAKAYSEVYRVLARDEHSADMVVFADQPQTGQLDQGLVSFVADSYDAIDFFCASLISAPSLMESFR